ALNDTEERRHPEREADRGERIRRSRIPAWFGVGLDETDGRESWVGIRDPPNHPPKERSVELVVRANRVWLEASTWLPPRHPSKRSLHEVTVLGVDAKVPKSLHADQRLICKEPVESLIKEPRIIAPDLEREEK